MPALAPPPALKSGLTHRVRSPLARGINAGLKKVNVDPAELAALSATVVTAVLSKATGAVYRMEETKKESESEYRYVAKREWENLALVALATIVTQTLTYPMVKKFSLRWLPAHNRNIDALIRLALIAPGLYASETLSRIFAGKAEHDALLKFNEHINHNWEKLLATTQSGRSPIDRAYGDGKSNGDGRNGLPNPHNLQITATAPVLTRIV
jgi:hypothetical protein